MRNCSYILTGTDGNQYEFQSEAALDDFILEKSKNLRDNGFTNDIVFSRSAKNLRAQNILKEQLSISQELEAKRQLWSKAKRNGIDLDSDVMLMPDPPYVGVTKFLDGRKNSSGRLLTPEFIEDNYWDDRISHWTSQIPNGKSIKDMFNSSEIRLLAEGNNDDERYKNFQNSRMSGGTYIPLSQEEATNLQKSIKKKWNIVNTEGTAIHFVMQQYFSTLTDTKGNPLTDKKGKIYHVFDLTNTPQTINNIQFPSITEYIQSKINSDLKEQMGRKFNPELITPTLLNNILNYAEGFHKHIKQIIDPNTTEEFDYYPEFKITGDLHNVSSGPQKLMGILDLVVLDKNGIPHIFDYKCSDKTYSEFSEAKKRGFYYQQGIYNRLLRQHGLNTFKNKIRIVPITLKDFKCTNREYLLTDPNKVEFNFNDNIYTPPQYSVDIKGYINGIGADGTSKILDNIDEFLPEEKIVDITTDNAISFVTGMMHEFFPDYTSGKDIDRNLVEQEIKEAGGFERDKNGKYSFNITTNRKLSYNDPEQLLAAVIAEKKRQQYRKANLAQTVIEALQFAQTNNTKDIQNIVKNIDTKYIDDKEAFQGWFKNYLQRYCNNDWEVIPNESARYFGIILLRNNITNQLDIIKTSSANLKSRRKLPNNSNTNLTRAFESDIDEKANNKSLMLEDVEGNREMIETLLFLNTTPSLFSGIYNNAVVGNIEVINPFKGQGLSASNEELLYSLNKLKQYKAFTDTDNYLNGNIKVGQKWQLFQNELQEALNNGSGFNLANQEYFSQAQNEIHTIVTGDNNKEAKINALLKVISGLEKEYNIDQLSANQLNSETNLSPVYRLYYNALITLGELRGLRFRQQLKESSKWIEGGVEKILTNGINGIYIDNPGNLASETLNSITSLYTQATQNIRNDMKSPTAKIRELTEKLKKAKNFGYATSLVQNDIQLYKNMFQITSDGDMRFTYINDLFGVEKEYLQYALRVINENRFPNYTKETLDKMEQDNDIRYYRVPLCRAEKRADERDASIKVRRNEKGEIEHYSKSLWQSLTDTIKSFSPTQAWHDIQEKINGVFTENEEQYNSAQKLFDLTNMFDRNEPDASGNTVQDRIDNILSRGSGYFEQNMETLVLKHVFAYSTKNRLNQIMPTVKAGMAFLINMGNSQNTNFKNDLEYYEDYIRNKMKGQPIEDDPIVGNSAAGQHFKAFTSKIRSVASYMALAWNPVQGIYQTIQGIWNDISLIIRKPDGTDAFTFSNMLDAFKIVFTDLFHYSDTPTKCQLINEWMGINDMDMNQYADKLRNDRHGLYNLNELAYKFASRPDFYNRMTIIIAQMKQQGVWDALDMQNNSLVYNFKKDKRFSAYANNDTSNPKYEEQKSLYLAIAQQFVDEGVSNPDGTLFEIGQPLPYAYTNKEAESMKSLCDYIYGYYSHEKRSMIHETFLGGMFMQMRTYWSGKKNQYMNKGGVRLMGHWEQLKDSDGNELYYQTDEKGHINRDVPPVPKEQLKNKNMLIPFTQWKGQWQEGIIQTLAHTVQAMYRDDAINWYNPYTWINGYNRYLDNLDPNMRVTYRQNMRQLWVDLLGILLLGTLLGGMLIDKNKEIIREAKESGSLTDAMIASISNIGTRSLINSTSDFNFVSSVLGPLFNWNAYTLNWGQDNVKRIWNVAFGDTTAYDAITKSFAATKVVSPIFTYLAPDGGAIFPDEEE